MKLATARGLDEIARDLNEAHNKVGMLLYETALQAKTAGELLIEAKGHSDMRFANKLIESLGFVGHVPR